MLRLGGGGGGEQQVIKGRRSIEARAHNGKEEQSKGRAHNGKCALCTNDKRQTCARDERQIKKNIAHSPKKSNNGLAHIVMQIQKHQQQIGMKMYLLLQQENQSERTQQEKWAEVENE